MSDTNNSRWYVVHTYSGYENKVKSSLEKTVENLGFEDTIEKIVIPEETVVETKNGIEKTRQRKIFPGYVLIKMIVTDDSWYLVRNTNGVTGFVGTTSKPIPLTDREVEKLHLEEEKIVENIDINTGDRIRISSGPLVDKEAVVSEIIKDKKMVRAVMIMFGKETYIELGFNQIKKI